MTEYRSDLPPRPRRMEQLPIDERGFPIPWFVHIDSQGVPDFRVIRPGGIAVAFNHHTCWLCGGRLGVYSAYVIGPMCGINRVTSEPGCHLECALYAVRSCPFMTRPLAVRDEKGLPEDASVAGIMVKRNPGCCIVWSTRHCKSFRAPNGFLFRLGEPSTVLFYARGREATRDEVEASVKSGLPILLKETADDIERKALGDQVFAFEGILNRAFPRTTGGALLREFELLLRGGGV